MVSGFFTSPWLQERTVSGEARVMLTASYCAFAESLNRSFVVA